MDELERESRQWMIQCPACGTERSYWEIGGIRYKGFSKGKRLLGRCRKCDKLKWHKVYKKTTRPSP